MKTVVVILVILLVAVAAILILAAMKPATFRITRGTSINAPPDKIFPLIADFRAWSAWSPWEKKDPALKRTYGGPASGQGAVYEWEGNSKVGKGAWRSPTRRRRRGWRSSSISSSPSRPTTPPSSRSRRAEARPT